MTDNSVNSEEPIFHARLEFLGSNSQNKGGKSDKFYEVTVRRVAHHYEELRRWGKYGISGQTKIVKHYDAYSAVHSAEKMLAQKRRRGYHDCVGALIRLADALDD